MIQGMCFRQHVCVCVCVCVFVLVCVNIIGNHIRSHDNYLLSLNWCRW
jgi:hypothetical protein